MNKLKQRTQMLTFLFVLSLVLVGNGGTIENGHPIVLQKEIPNSAHSPHLISGFEDSAKFSLFVKETLLATAATSISRSGQYQRTMRLSMAGQTLDYSMHVLVDVDGQWETIEIVDPGYGTLHVRRTGNQAIYTFYGEQKKVHLPDSYILYDDYGMFFESLMLRKYDMTKKGKQVFKRFRVPQTHQVGHLIDVELEYLGEESHQIDGREWPFLKFNWKLMGENVIYWVDSEFKIYMTDQKTQSAAGVREGFEELMKPKSSDLLISQPEFKVDKKTVMVPMRDGVRLSTDLYFPISNQIKFPAIHIRTPYKKENAELDGKYYARRGYVCAVQDTRGRFASEGFWEPFVNEAEDGYDSIEWLASQTWSTGKIGMIGASYGGWVQLWASSLKPPHLTTIIPNVAPPDPFYNIPYEYGAFFTVGALWWAEVVESEATADLSGKTLFQINDRNYESIVNTLPVIELDKKIFGKVNPYWRKWVEHNTNDSYWEKANFLDKLKDLDIPVFLQSGWYDGDGIGSKLIYENLKESKNKHIKLILGPWEHTDTATSSVRGQDVGAEAAIDLRSRYMQWFDYWLKGTENGILEEPLVKIFTIDSKKWLESETYPLPETEFKKLYLSSQKGANTLNGDGRLVWDIPESAREFDSYTYDPGDPTPAWMMRFRKGGKKGYESITNRRKDILVYESKPFEKPLTIAGPVSAKIYASSSAVDTDWFVSYTAVSDRGEVISLTPHGKGVIRARFRNSTSKPELLEKDKIYEYTIDLWQTGWTLQKGWKLRVEVTSAFFPLFSRNLNTGGHNEMETEYVMAHQKIYHSEDYPSHILLPVITFIDESESK